MEKERCPALKHGVESLNTIYTAKVEVTENLGHEMLLYLSGLGTDTVLGRVDKSFPYFGFNVRGRSMIFR
ncbi:hypothetical protein BBD41_13455 [Paenibacillus ihbetae]|uniref:Uncharacterized protein n=1 Tax=Paenibacillus ihbetae TaxID=1870820 RepID=A0A1B2E0R2_9BACL|nr:hypothetical protein BBD41_13455 [Paenibacillus ihbetae]